MTTQVTIQLEPVSYWIRIEDMVPNPQIRDRLIEHAHRGTRLMRSQSDLGDWIHEAEALLELVDGELRQTGGAYYPDLVEVARSTPVIDSLRSLLAASR